MPAEYTEVHAGISVNAEGDWKIGHCRGYIAWQCRRMKLNWDAL